MNRNVLFALWGGLFILCAGLGFIPEPTGAVRWLLTALSLAFFLPPALLLRQGEDRTVKLVRNLAALSLAVTAVTLSLNFLLAIGPEFLGNVLHFVLAVVSTPMLSSGSWVMSMFLWACLLIAGFRKGK
ncbi:MAG: hypothetical protein Q4F17_12620 [Eubacteriales bacterium]|nr:hypothetical protein [Eubacteriales bacterium]